MLVNPTLLEHEVFTDMLWAVFHFTDELLARDSITDLPSSDIMHLNYDAKRAFSALLVQWIHYMSHLKTDYPYLFSLETRRNPFNGSDDIIVR
jgi:voltage-gated potassium channel